MPEQVDELINGRYRLTAVIGQGTMGTVWRGHDEVLGREVAIKKIILPADLSVLEQTELKALAMSEARATAALSHPGVITVFDVIEHDHAPVIVMELVKGRSLAEILREQVRLPWRRAAEIGAAMVDALSEAHAAGIVHRDLKPANVLIAGRRIVITDFGIAQQAGEHTAADPGEVTGTPAFMSPEQAENAAASPAADLWSLGATLFNTVEGTPPYQGRDYASVLLLLLSQDPPKPRNAGPLTPLITALLSKDPRRRPPAEQVAAELETILRTETTPPQPPTSTSTPTPTSAQATSVAPPPTSVPSPASASAPPPAPPLPLAQTSAPPPAQTSAQAPAQAQAQAPAQLQGLASASASGRTSATAPAESGPVPQVPLKRPGRSTGRRAILAGLGAVGLVAIFGVAIANYGTLGGHAPKRTTPTGGVVVRKSAVVLTGPLAFSPTGRMLAAGESVPAGPGAVVELFGTSDHRRLGTITVGASGLRTLAFSPDGTELATGDDGGHVDVWNTATRTKIASVNHRADDLRFDGNGKSVLTCDDNGRYGNWTIGHGKPAMRSIPGTGVQCLALNPGGTALTAYTASSHTLTLWTNLDGHPTPTPLPAPWQSATTAVSRTLFSPDGRTLAITRYDTGSPAKASGQGAVELWDVASRTRLATHDITLYKGGGLAFSPDGKTIAATTADGDISLWKLGVYGPGGTLPGPFEGGADSLAFGADGRSLATGGNDGTIRIWDLKTARLTATFPAG